MKKTIVTISVAVVLLSTVGLLLLYATPRSHVSQQTPPMPCVSPAPIQSPAEERSSTPTNSSSLTTTTPTGTPQAERLQIDPQFDVGRYNQDECTLQIRKYTVPQPSGYQTLARWVSYG